MPKKPILLLTLILTLLTPTRTLAAPHADVEADSATLDFPNTATFSATIKSAAEIVSVTLEYGNEQLNCGEAIAKAFPDFQPGKSVAVSWTWDMRQSGSLPPGTAIWWRWRYADSSGAESVSETQTVAWLDNLHPWQTVSNKDLHIHYYGNDQDFANAMLNAGVEGLRRNKEQAGMTPDAPVDIYVYPNYDDMREAVLYEPAWTGGQAYSDFNIIIMGSSGSDATWDQNTVIHELTHILVGRSAFSCLGSRPGWLEEGLAMYSEGKLDPGMQSMLDQAIRSDSLMTLRSLNGGFSENPDKANLSYAQSYSVVKFLIENYSQEKMGVFLKALSDAKSIDDSLREAYELDTDGLDSAWRASVGAAPLAVAQATAQPTPTWAPTYVPIQGIPQAVTSTPGGVPTSSHDDTNQPTPSSGPPWMLTISLICFCLVFLLIIGVIALAFIVRGGNAKGGKDA